MARWSSGQDASLSRWKHGFDSRTGHQKKNTHRVVCVLFLSTPSRGLEHAAKRRFADVLPWQNSEVSEANHIPVRWLSVFHYIFY